MHGGEVGQHAAQPAFIHIGHPHASGLFGDGFLGLFLGADKHQRAAVSHGLLDKVIGDVDVGCGLSQVQNVDAGTFGQDETLHLGVPATGLMPEMYATFQHLAHSYDCHRATFFQLVGQVFRCRCEDVATVYAQRHEDADAVSGPVSVSAWCATPSAPAPGPCRAGIRDLS